MSSVNLSFKGVGPEKPFDFELPGIILLHGMTSSQLTWDNLMRPIANGTGRKVFTYDARNHGDSEWIDEIGYESMVTDLSNIMSNLHMSKATLVGHSMGGKVAMKFALERPDMVEKLIIEDISPKPRPPGDRRYIHMYIELLRRSLEAIPEEVKSLNEAKEKVAAFMREQTPEEHRSDRNMSLPSLELPLKMGDDGKFEWKANLDAITERLLNAFPSLPVEGKYEGPAFFLYGTRSHYNVINEKDFILQHFPKATFSGIEGGGHLLHAEYPEEFTKAVVDFFNNS